MKKLLTLILIAVSFSVFAQKKYYNNVVNNYQGDSSSEIIELVKGTTLLNYDFKDINGNVISTDKTKKPIFIAAIATWSGPVWAGVPAMNKIIEKNHDKIDFIFIFWDKEEKIRKVAHKFNEHIALIPPRDEDKVEKGNLNISGFVHKIKDYPTGYLINKNKELINIFRGSAVPNKERTMEQAIEVNYGLFKEALSSVIDVE